MKTIPDSLAAAALARAYINIPAHWTAELGRQTRLAQAGFEAAAAKIDFEIRLAGFDLTDIPSHTELNEVYTALVRGITAFDPRGGTLSAQATSVSNKIALALARATATAAEQTRKASA